MTLSQDTVTERFLAAFHNACAEMKRMNNDRMRLQTRMRHTVHECVCMDGRVPLLPLPRGMTQVTPVAGGVPDLQHHRYQQFLTQRVQQASQAGKRIMSLLRIHTECAAFNKNLTVATAEAVDFLNQAAQLYGSEWTGFVQLYNVTHGRLDILHPKLGTWSEFSALARDDGTLNLEHPLVRTSSPQLELDDVLDDLLLMAHRTRMKPRSAGQVVQQHREIGIVAGARTMYWRDCPDFLSYRTDLITHEDHVRTLDRACAVVHGSLTRMGRRNDPIEVMLVTGNDATETKEALIVFRAALSAINPPRRVDIMRYSLHDATHQLRRID